MMIKTEIVCKTYKHKKLVDGKLIVSDPSEEYYIIPVNREYHCEKGRETVYLEFKNQLLWLKYSNRFNEILVDELYYGYTDFIIIKSVDIVHIEARINTTRYFRKNVWSSDNNVRLNSRYNDSYFLVLPVIDDLINVDNFGIGIQTFQIRMITNEVRLCKPIVNEHNCSLMIPNNYLLNKDALFIELHDGDIGSFL